MSELSRDDKSHEDEPTPETDAFEATCGDYEKPFNYARRLAAFARTLERRHRISLRMKSSTAASINSKGVKHCQSCSPERTCWHSQGEPCQQDDAARMPSATASASPSISPGLRVVLREYDLITDKAARGNPEWDFVMRAADYRLIRECLAKLPIEIVNPPKGWTP